MNRNGIFRRTKVSESTISVASMVSFISIAVIVAAALFIGGCGSVPQSEQITYTPDIARLVTHVSTTVDYRSDSIRIRFSEPMDSSGPADRSIDFSPKFRFDSSWEDPSTLAITPRRALDPGTIYRGTVDLSTIAQDESIEGPLEFDVRAAGIEILEQSIGLESVGDEFVVSGTISFSADVGAEIDGAISLRRGMRNFPIDTIEMSDSNTIRFRSAPIPRTDHQRTISVELDQRRLGLSRSFERAIVIPALDEFSVIEINPVPGGAGLRLELSDALDSEQLLDGLISINPPVSASIRSAGREIYLLGDFTPGENYAIEVSAQIRSDDGSRGGVDQNFDVVAPNLEPRIEYLSDGVFLPSANQNTLGFRTMNLQEVNLRIVRVFENNIGQFLQTESFASDTHRTLYFSSSYLSRVGVEIVRETLDLGETKNDWVINGIDLARIFEGEPKGLYVVSLQYDESDILAKPGDYYYRYWETTIYKPVVATDLGITYKQLFDEHLVYVTNLLDARPAPGVSVELRSYQHQIIAKGITGRDGFVSFKDASGGVFYVTAEDGRQRSVIKLNEMGWNLSSFDSGGVEVTRDRMRSYIYTERGVYRPGDPIHLSVILRNADDTFPENHPISVTWHNPLGQLVSEYQQNEGVDGFYGVVLETDANDPTGEWLATIEAGGNSFSHAVHVETAVPFTLKVDVIPGREHLTYRDSMINFDIESRYLFGTPAAGLEAEATVSLEHRTKRFDSFPGFSFTDEAVDLAAISAQVFRGVLDDDGRAEVTWRIPNLSDTPSALDANLNVRVIEKGGRPNIGIASVSLEPYDRYVGLERPDMPYGYAKMGSEISVRQILVDTDGNPLPGRRLLYRVYKNESYWWWEYDSRVDFRLHYKTDTNTTLVSEGTTTTALTPVSFTVTPDDWGEYYVEVSDRSNPGHVAGFFFRSSWWGANPSGSDEASLLALRTDRAAYSVGDTATVLFPSPPSGTILMTLEQASGVIESRIIELTGEDETRVKIDLTRSMVPNVYVSLSLMQPHSQTANDRPLRLYGVIPLEVEDPASRVAVTIDAPDEIEPGTRFAIGLASDTGARTQMTIAVVDEGLLDLTRFETPDPWLEFFRKQRLAVRTFDTFSHVIGANDGDFFRLFSVGGGYDQGLFAGDGEDEKRFEPVSLFAGPFWTDDNGFATVEFEMPNYVGSVRIMAIAADGGAYGSADVAVPVKTDLVLLPSFPRVIGPDEEFVIPVTVFGLGDDLGRVTVSIDAEGATIDGERIEILEFDRPGERDVAFRVRTPSAVGTARFTVRAIARAANAVSEVSIPLRASSPRIGARESATIEIGSTVSLAIPDDGIPGTNTASLGIARQPDLEIDHRIRWLIRYPYGCVEQTTSAVFPQLFLESLGAEIDAVRVDTNINAGIERLRRFQLTSGGFSYWPGGTSVSAWGTNYAGHFLIEADRLGYFVPAQMLSGWIRYQSSRALSTSDGLMERVYRVYLLALAGEASLPAMNLLYEENLRDMSDTMRWLLADAYLIRGMDDVASEIIAETGREATVYRYYGSTYGSALRDEAMILESLVLTGRWGEAQEVFGGVARHMSSDGWYSTQTSAYALMAMGKFLKANSSGGDVAPRLSGRVTLPGGEFIGFDTEKSRIVVPIDEGFGDEITVTLDEETNFERAFLTLDWEGIPLRSGTRPVTRNLTVAVTWYDETGRPLNPARIQQGSSFWGLFRAGKTDEIALDELALLQIVPSGWEIENLRLSGEQLPDFIPDGANNAEYVDIRDDRIIWFFDLQRHERSREFAVKINAVTEGVFYLPQVTFEAMYDDSYYASRPGRTVQVR